MVVQSGFIQKGGGEMGSSVLWNFGKGDFSSSRRSLARSFYIAE